MKWFKQKKKTSVPADDDIIINDQSFFQIPTVKFTLASSSNGIDELTGLRVQSTTVDFSKFKLLTIVIEKPVGFKQWLWMLWGTDFWVGKFPIFKIWLLIEILLEVGEAFL